MTNKTTYLNNMTNSDIIKTLAHTNPVLNYNFPKETMEYIKANASPDLIDDLVTNANSLYKAVLNKIGKTMFVDSHIADELDFISVDSGIQFGDMIEALHVGIAKTYTFTPNSEPNPFIREKSDVKAIYYSKTFQEYHRQSIEDSETRKAFLSANGVGQLLSRKLASMNDSARLSMNYKKYTLLKALEDEYAHLKVTEPTDKDKAVTFLKELIDLVSLMKDNTSDYNAMNVMTSTSASDMVLLIDRKYKTIITVDMVKDVFNIEKLDLPYRIEYVRELGSSEKPHNLDGIKEEPIGVIDKAVGLLVHKDFYHVEIEYEKHGVTPNEEGRYSNHVYHRDGKTYGLLFRPAVALYTTLPTARPVDSVWSKQREIDNATEPVDPEIGE